MLRSFLRWSISALLALVALFATVTAVFVFDGDWRTPTFDQALEEATGWQWDLGSTKVGWNHFEATDVFAMQGGQGFQVGGLSVDIPGFRSWRDRVLYLENGSFTGAFLDLSSSPPEALGITAAELRTLPPTNSADEAVGMLVEATLMRLSAQGFALVAQQVEVEGSLLLPLGRRLFFRLTLEEASTLDLEAARYTIHQSELR